MFFQDRKIGFKLGSIFGLLFLMMAVVIGLGLFGTKSVDRSVETIAKGNYVRTLYALQASKAVNDISASIRMLVLLQDPGALGREKEKIQAARGRYRDAMGKLDELEQTGRGHDLLEEAKRNIVPAVQANDRVAQLALERKQAEATQLLLSEAIPLTQKVQEIFDQEVQFQQEKVDEAYLHSVAVYHQQKWLLLGTGAVALVLGLGAVLLLTRNFTIRLKTVADAMSRVADGNLSLQVEDRDRDEIGDLSKSINRMLSSTGAMITSIKNTENELASSADILYSANEQIAEIAESVAGQTGTVATASEEMAATSMEIAQNCSLAAESSRQGSSLAEEGVAVVQMTVAGMSRIAEKVKESAAMVATLGSRSEQIGAIVGTIEDIADQTNLLALNAAIEAARAGDQGRGFAVVADEVRALAERTTKATKEIGQMIRSIQNETKGAVDFMKQGVAEVERGTQDAAKSGAALEEIKNQIEQVAEQINQIATAAEQQMATTTEITGNIQNITDVITMSASCSHDSADAAKQLLTHSGELHRLVELFTLTHEA